MLFRLFVGVIVRDGFGGSWRWGRESMSAARTACSSLNLQSPGCNFQMRPSMQRVALTVMGALAATLAFTLPAAAHAKMTAATPAADSVVTESPKELRMTFNEGLIAKFSNVEVTSQDGQKVETGAAAADPADKKQIVLPLPKVLADGVYNVNWQAVTDDTHRVKGTYSFTVKH
jgi:copper resistance protein C